MPDSVASPDEFPQSHFENTVPGRAAQYDAGAGPTVPAHPASAAAEPTQPGQAMRGAGVAPPAAIPAAAAPPVARQTVRPAAPPRPKRTRKSSPNWLLFAGMGAMALVVSSCMALVIGGVILFNSGILPGVSAGGVAVGSMTEAEAAAEIAGQWDAITLRDGARTWRAAPSDLGIVIDAAATAERAHAQGRGSGSIITAVFGEVTVAPVIRMDAATLRAGLDRLAPQIELTPQNVGIEMINGVIRATPPQAGRLLDTAATVQAFADDPDLLADGVLDLVMRPLQPQVMDSSALVSTATQILTRSFDISAFDPVTGETALWSLPPETWGGWLSAEADNSSSSGVRLTADPTRVRDYLSTRNVGLAEARYLDLDAATATIQQAIRENRTQATIRVFYGDRVHVVQSGESIISIAWDYGVPYPWIQQANPGVGDAIAIGQEIVIPSPDNFFDYEPIANKRIVVSMSEQRTRVYENGTLKWDWPASTGISDSPTWPGVYQIISHVPNAYAARWNLYMPYFMGVYRPIPGQDFTNGFHGFPTRGNSQLLWTNSLGRRVTYGCILLSNTNAQLLYDWAETGVVVEILP